MKTLINSLQENTTNRLKNPLIGAFVFSWTIWNSSDLLVFLLSNKEQKIALVEHAKFDLINDFLAPFGFTLLYLLLVPVLNMLYERLIDGVVNKHRNAFNQKTLQQHYYTVKKTTIAKLDSDEEENRKLRDRQLDRWADEKRQMSETVISFRSEYSEKMAKIDNEIGSYKEEIHRLTSEVYDLNTEVESFQQGLTRIVRDVELDLEQLLSVRDLPQHAEDAARKIKASCIKAKKVLKVPVLAPSPGSNGWEKYNEPPMDFDDDIPF
ncbi:hypothetical protein [Vibrio splendidus]|uniref:hypothetical protein n=1 Tax=Vibrio splendidus TaxID=29497 RepID=UPI0011B29B2A|nr:hypothetical protein [Vibrio splendidus]